MWVVMKHDDHRQATDHDKLRMKQSGFGRAKMRSKVHTIFFTFPLHCLLLSSWFYWIVICYIYIYIYIPSVGIDLMFVVPLCNKQSVFFPCCSEVMLDSEAPSSSSSRRAASLAPAARPSNREPSPIKSMPTLTDYFDVAGKPERSVTIIKRRESPFLVLDKLSTGDDFSVWELKWYVQRTGWHCAVIGIKRDSGPDPPAPYPGGPTHCLHLCCVQSEVRERNWTTKISFSFRHSWRESDRWSI